MVSVELDGHQLLANLDTGASTSVLNLGTAQSTFGLTPGGPDTPAGPDFAETHTYTHRFKSLGLEGIAISNLNVALLPDLVRGKMTNPHDSIAGGTRLANPNREVGLSPMILGMDVLHRLHVYIAYKEKKLYVTPAAPPVEAHADSPAPAATAAK